MPEKQTEKRKQTIHYHFQKILTGSDLSTRRLPLMEATSERPGPVVWLSGCVHGDEVGGVVVIQEVFKRLKKHPLIKGTLFAYPMMNPIGFENASRHISISKEDLNRAFPGDPRGSLAQRIAGRIFSTIAETGPDLVLDLHNDWIKSIPYSLLDQTPEECPAHLKNRIRSAAELTGFIMINEQAQDALAMDRTISGSLIKAGVPALTLELGESHVVNEKNVHDGTVAVWRVLSGMGMTKEAGGILNYIPPDRFRGLRLDYTQEPTSSKSGIIRFLKGPGDVVKKGDPIGRIYNVFGKLKETLVSECEGIVLGHSDSSVALPGSPVAAFGKLTGID